MAVRAEVNNGSCIFCGDYLWKCDEDGDRSEPTDNWVICGDDSCQRGAISTNNYDELNKCDNCDRHEQDYWCEDCEREDCSECDKIDRSDCENDCDDCDAISEDDAHRLVELVKKARTGMINDGSSFRIKTMQDLQDEVEEIAQYLEHNCGCSL